MNTKPLSIGIDVGSTTVKAVLIDPSNDEILWRDYQRHEGEQLAKTLEMLRKVEADSPGLTPERLRVFVTGSGAGALETCLGAKFVQEVNAVALAVERLFPEVGSVVELGGQDAKIIIFKDDPALGGKKKIPTMNDKCAGGTGAVLDKISAKLGIPPNELADQGYDGLKLHHVAGKCGVFAETDINSLQLVGIPTDQLMASLFDAIVGQNLSVLTRGNTLLPHVLLLGGPNTFIRGMAEAWKANIPAIWEERDVELPTAMDPADLIFVPENAQYFAAIGTVEYGKTEELDVGRYAGLERLERLVESGSGEVRAVSSRGLSSDREDLAQFRRRYPPAVFEPASFSPGERVRAFLGLDGGSTSTKGVLMDEKTQVLGKAYQLSKGNPIEDTKEIIAKLLASVEDQGASLEVVGFGVTGYAKDVLKEVFGADVAVVETVAHTTSALHFYDEVDVICDVGGQDIKIMVLTDGQVKDFKLNTQCSAGNGYFLQSTAQSLGIRVEDFAEVAFRAETMPTFGHGCAVFLQSDIVNFQRQGWKPEQILAGLASVLPRNIWLYVAQIPNPARLGRRFILQGGTQHNLAAVKAQVDFIQSRFRGNGAEPEILVHKHCGESGAIGAALESMRVLENGGVSSFIGLTEAAATTYVTTTDERTRCRFCKNKCLRTFIDVRVGQRNGDGAQAAPADSAVPLARGARRLIVGNSCEKGLVESVADMRTIKAKIDATTERTPNFSEIEARSAFRSPTAASVADPTTGMAGLVARTRRRRLAKAREDLRIGIPRVLAMYQTAPLFRAYFESLGVSPRNLVFSDSTSPKLYKEGAKRGSIDPCFPSKLAIPHVHNLIYVKHQREPLDVIFFPMIDDVPSELESALGHRICPTITATPEAVRAAFTKEDDVFAKKGIRFMNTFTNIGQLELFERQMYEAFKELLGLSKDENRKAVQAGLNALTESGNAVRSAAKDELRRLEAEGRIGIVLLGRPYHADQGINHDILGEFQKLGYPIFTPSSLPVDRDVLEPLFGDEVRQGVIDDPLDIRDVWKNAYSENSNWKLWAAKFTARHPNLIALEVNSFRCGHDSPICSVIESIVEASDTPFFCFRDLDENKPSGSIKIRVETVDYFLKRFKEGLVSNAEVRHQNRLEFSRLRPNLPGQPSSEAPRKKRTDSRLIQLRVEEQDGVPFQSPGQKGMGGETAMRPEVGEAVEEHALTVPSPVVSRGRIKRGLTGFAALTVAGLGILFASTFRGDVETVFGGLSPTFLWLAVLAMVADFLLGPLRMYVLLKHVVPGTRFSLLFRADMAGRFLGAVTPSQTGGGPCQIFMMVRGGIPLPEVLSVLMVNFIATLVVLAFAGGTAMWMYQGLLEGAAIRYLLQWTFAAFLGGMALAALSLTRPELVASLLGRWRGRLDGMGSEWSRTLARGVHALSEAAERYRSTCVRCVAEWPLLPVVSLLLTLLLYLNKFMLGWFVARGLGLEVSFWSMLALQALLTFILYVAPTPGGSGVAELSTGALMAVLLPTHLLGPFTLAHRLFLTYLPAAFGAFILAGALRPGIRVARRPAGRAEQEDLDDGGPGRTAKDVRANRRALRRTAAVALVCLLMGSLLWPILASGQVVPPQERGRISIVTLAEIPAETPSQIRNRRVEYVNDELIKGMMSADREDSLAAFSTAVDTAYALVLADGDLPDAHYLYAVALGQRLELSGTREKIQLGGMVRREAETALDLDPDHGGAHHVLGRLNAAAMRLGRIERFVARRLLGAKSLDGASWEKAEYHFKRAAEQLPGDALNWVELGALYVDTRRKVDAVEVLKRAAEVPPMDPVRTRGRERALGMLCSLDPRECPG